MSKKIHVIQLVDGFATSEASGGAALFGIRLARMLNKENITPMVCGLWHYNTDSEHNWLYQLQAEEVQVYRLIRERKQLSFDLIRAAGYLQAVINDDEPIIINTHFERGDLLALTLKTLLPKKKIAIIRTVHQDNHWLKRPWMGQVMNILYPWIFNAEVAISKTTQQWLDKRFVARVINQPSKLIYNGLSHAEVAAFSRFQRIREPFTPPRFAIVGRLELQKGHHFFLESAALILQTYPQAEFWIIGTGSLTESLQQEANNLGINTAITWWGARSDIASILSEVDVLVSTSLWEGLPTVILEAMAARVPIIATDISGSRELITEYETGLIVPSRDVSALYEAMRWIIVHPQSAYEMTERAFYMLQQYTLERTATAYENLYRDVLELF